MENTDFEFVMNRAGAWTFTQQNRLLFVLDMNPAWLQRDCEAQKNVKTNVSSWYILISTASKIDDKDLFIDFITKQLQTVKF